MKGMRCLTDKGAEALKKGEVVCLGSFSTKGFDKRRMYNNINGRQFVGPWCPNLFEHANFRPTKEVNFRLVAVCKPDGLDKQWERAIADTLAKEFGFGNVMPTIEMAYYLWEGRVSFMKLNDQKPSLSCLVVCHSSIDCGKDVCKRIAVIDNKMIFSGGISGQGHHFGEEAGYVYVLPE